MGRKYNVSRRVIKHPSQFWDWKTQLDIPSESAEEAVAKADELLRKQGYQIDVQGGYIVSQNPEEPLKGTIWSETNRVGGGKLS